MMLRTRFAVAALACALMPSAAVDAQDDTAVAAFAAAEAGRSVEERLFRDRLASGGEGPDMVAIPAGSFLMGSAEGRLLGMGGERGRFDDEGPQHPVTVAAFAAGRYEVTFDEWDACVAAGGCTAIRSWVNGVEGLGRGPRPVDPTSWNDAQAYARWLSAETGERYRLLSEAEWEYAARAGTTTPWTWGDDQADACRFANLHDRAAVRDIEEMTAAVGARPIRWDAVCDDGFGLVPAAPVGSFLPNAFGLHDMHGNVSEWVEDCYHQDYAGAPSDGSAWTSGSCEPAWRVERGGHRGSEPRYVRSASRNYTEAGTPHGDVGFRLARVLSPP